MYGRIYLFLFPRKHWGEKSPNALRHKGLIEVRFFAKNTHLPGYMQRIGTLPIAAIRFGSTSRALQLDAQTGDRQIRSSG